MSQEYGWEISKIQKRIQQIDRINDYFGFDGFYNLKLKPAGLTSLDEGLIISKIKNVFDDVMPEWIIIPGNYDAHSDHSVVYNCCMACAKPFRAPYIKRIMTMEIPSETNFGFQNYSFEPNYYVDISEEIERKLEAISIYESEIENPPFPRSIEAIRSLSVVRGSSCMCTYAEAFKMIRCIE